MHSDSWTPHRRQWLQWAGSAAATLASPCSFAQSLPSTSWPVTEQLFGLGVASGDPAPDGMVLWTRLMPSPQRPLLGPTPVRWELAHDAQFRQIVQSGETMAEPGWGHSVHVEVRGLPPVRWYHYRFLADGEASTVGRTCTAPAPNSRPAQLRLVFASCQRWEHGFYTAWQHALRDDPELVLFLGDYIYEYATPPSLDGLARTQPLPYPRTLQDYRDRYALHKSDAHLQAMHAHCPWIVTWDDHEVENDYAGHEGVGDHEAFLRKRLAAWQAFYENMPLRASTLSRGISAPQIYRRLPWGQLADLLVLDARQYRTIQACRSAGKKNNGSVVPADCAELAAAARSFLGQEQERWLSDRFKDNSAARNPDLRWNVLCQQTLFAPRHYPNGHQATDSWDGYPAARSRLLQALQQYAPRNTVLLGGDIHQNYVCRIHAPDASGAVSNDTPVLASEFCGTSITSHAGTTQAKVDAIVRRNPQVLFARCEERGYGLCNITPQQWTTRLQALNDPLDARSGIHTQASFAVVDREPGPVQL